MLIPGACSAEVLANLRYSDKADVYSFGIVLWECAARQVPYSGMTGMPAAIAVMNRCVASQLACVSVLESQTCLDISASSCATM